MIKGKDRLFNKGSLNSLVTTWKKKKIDLYFKLYSKYIFNLKCIKDLNVNTKLCRMVRKLE